MSTNSGPQSHAAAVKAAQVSQQNVAPGGYTNTNGWSHAAKQTFYGNGGR